jgi:hypothetical protein
MNDFTRGYMRGYKDAQKEALSTKCVAQPEQCTGCEGKPSSANNPCAVCGNSQLEQEPVGYFNANSDGKWEQSDSNDGVPFYAALPPQPKEPAVAEQHKQEPLEYWNAVEGWVKIDEVREHFDSVGCGTIYKTAGEGRVPLSLCKAQTEQELQPEWLEQAFREGWARCRDAEFVGEDEEDWQFGNSTANSRMIDLQQNTTPPPVTESHKRKPLSGYINGAGINANDSPHIVVEKLERAIEAAHGIRTTDFKEKNNDSW